MSVNPHSCLSYKQGPQGTGSCPRLPRWPESQPGWSSPGPGLLRQPCRTGPPLGQSAFGPQPLAFRLWPPAQEKNPASVPSSARQPKAKELFVFLTGLTKPPEQLHILAEAVPVKGAFCLLAAEGEGPSQGRNQGPAHLYTISSPATTPSGGYVRKAPLPQPFFPSGPWSSSLGSKSA